jgi:hypothetical protein
MTKYSLTKILRRRISEGVREIRRLKLDRVNEDYLIEKIRALLNIGYVSRCLNINKPKVYRVRPNKNGKLFENARQLWWPPPEHITERGRLNKVGQSIFYCSDREDTAVLEKRPEQGEILTILECDLIDPNVQPFIAEVGIHEHPGRLNPKYGGTPPEQDIQLKDFTRREGIQETSPLLRQFLVDEFQRIVEPGHDYEYKITIAIAEILINEPELVDIKGNVVPDKGIDGLCYPSIAADSKGVNVALKTEAADRLYKPISCKVCRVEEVKDIAYYVLGELISSESVAGDGTINWKGR